MKSSSLILRGADRETLADLAKERFSGPSHRKSSIRSSKDLLIIASEEFYIRCASLVLSVIILDFGHPEGFGVDVVTSSGQSQFDWGAEQDRHSNVLQFFRDVCQARSWTLEETSG